MTVNELIAELQGWKHEGYGDSQINITRKELFKALTPPKCIGSKLLPQSSE